MDVEISVVAPVYNESGNLPELYKRLTKTLKSITQRYEIIFINDGSTDNTESLIRKIRRNDKKVKAVSFSRNFGHMAAVNAGLQVARGQRVVLMDADLQDTPELITQMYRQSLRGSQVGLEDRHPSTTL